MRSILPCVLVPALALACSAPRNAPAHSAVPAVRSNGDPVREVEAVLRAQEAAWNRSDLDAFMALGYAQSEALTFYSGGKVSRGYEPMLAGYRKRYQADRAEMGALAFTQLEIEALGDGCALARGRWDLDFAKEKDVGGLFTLVLRNDSGAWRIVHDHTSVD